MICLCPTPDAFADELESYIGGDRSMSEKIMLEIIPNSEPVTMPPLTEIRRVLPTTFRFRDTRIDREWRCTGQSDYMQKKILSIYRWANRVHYFNIA